MRPQISVILSIYNEGEYINRCLDSLAKQKGTTFEVIVVDDGSKKLASYEPADATRPQHYAQRCGQAALQTGQLRAIFVSLE